MASLLPLQDAYLTYNLTAASKGEPTAIPTLMSTRGRPFSSPSDLHFGLGARKSISYRAHVGRHFEMWTSQMAFFREKGPEAPLMLPARIGYLFIDQVNAVMAPRSVSFFKKALLVSCVRDFCILIPSHHLLRNVALLPRAEE